MFDAIIDKYIGQAGPAMQTAADRATWYAERIVSRLDEILDAVQSNEYEELRRTFPVTLGVGETKEITQVPTGQAWMLDLLSVNGATILTIAESGSFRMAKDYSGADFTQPASILFQSGSVITVRSTAAVSVYLVFKVEHEKKARPTRNAGDITQPADNLTANDAADRLGDHFARDTFNQGVNVRGERHALNGS